MYPDTTNNATDDLSLKRRKQLLIVISAVFVLVVIVLFIVFSLKPSFQEYALTKTGLKSQQQFGYLNKSSLYAFNGLAFTETNIENGSTKVLSSGQRMPIPRDIYWANSNGALFSFSSSFSLTPVESALQSMGEQLSYDGNDYTWYLDFKTNQLHLVNKQPITADLASYSERDGGFYYVPNDSSQLGVTTPLHFYDIATNKDATIASDLEVTDFSSIHEGVDKYTVLFTARDLNDTAKKRLYKVKQGSNKQLITQADRIFPTNNPGMYVVSTSDTLSPVEGEEADTVDGPAGLYDVTTKSTRALDFTVGTSDTSLYFVNDKDFVALQSNSGNDKDQFMYHSGSIDEKSARSSVYPLQDENKNTVTDQIVKLNGYGNGRLLVTTVGDGQELFSATTKKQTLPTLKQQNEAGKIVNECLGNDSKNQQYIADSKLFRVFFVADSSFTISIKQFSTCVLKKDSTGLIGYTFQFMGTDPVNGRISTD
ncbi:MAG TPA: hypothetical protein VK502_00105 [Candidatus Saccharimonadales bacterium]|nr:hypothetical protein [Candidatus Saccharimonadales bacterium]